MSALSVPDPLDAEDSPLTDPASSFDDPDALATSAGAAAGCGTVRPFRRACRLPHTGQFLPAIGRGLQRFVPGHK
eukprot:4693612-Alexandrium_andersonii.AAC.1